MNAHDGEQLRAKEHEKKGKGPLGLVVQGILGSTRNPVSTILQMIAETLGEFVTAFED